MEHGGVVGDANAEEARPLDSLLAQAVSNPSPLLVDGGGPIVALALHCGMVRDGFRVVDSRLFRAGGAYQPPAEWHGKYEHQWIFTYRRPGYANAFRMHCSLQAHTRRMFVHGSEQNCPANVATMGVRVDNYVAPDTPPAPAASPAGGPAGGGAPSSWQGVLARQDTLLQMQQQLFIGPLLAAAKALPAGSLRASSWGVAAACWADGVRQRWQALAGSERGQQQALLAAVGVSALLCAAVAAAYAAPRR